MINYIKRNYLIGRLMMYSIEMKIITKISKVLTKRSNHICNAAMEIDNEFDELEKEEGLI